MAGLRHVRRPCLVRAVWLPQGCRRSRYRLGAAGPEESIEKGYALVGTVDTVTRTLEKLRRRLPIEWVFCYTYNSLVPHDVLMKTIERFWTEVLPRVA